MQFPTLLFAAIGGFTGLIALTVAPPELSAVASIPEPTETVVAAGLKQDYQSQAKAITATLIKAQQNYFLSKRKFAASLSELGANIEPEDQDYQYRVFRPRKPDVMVMVTAMPKRSRLKSYVGLVNSVQNPRRELMSMAKLCESLDNKPLLPKLPTRVPTNREIPCPTGFQGLPLD